MKMIVIRNRIQLLKTVQLQVHLVKYERVTTHPARCLVSHPQCAWRSLTVQPQECVAAPPEGRLK